MNGIHGVKVVEVPSTYEMDSTTPEDRYKLEALFTSCYEWHFFTGSRDRFLQLHGEKCKCGGTSFTELRSQRTWNELWAKPIATKLKNKRKKR